MSMNKDTHYAPCIYYYDGANRFTIAVIFLTSLYLLAIRYYESDRENIITLQQLHS